MTFRVIDADGFDLEVGYLVEDRGIITKITEPDGDVNDHGQSVGINPRITVFYPDDADGPGMEETYTTSWQATGPWDEDAPYMCEDIVLAPLEESADPIVDNFSRGVPGPTPYYNIYDSKGTFRGAPAPQIGTKEYLELWGTRRPINLPKDPPKEAA